MLGFSRKLPVTEEERLWVDEGFVRLTQLLGRSRMLEATVILPNAEHFPDDYDRTPASAEILFQRMCAHLQVDRTQIELEIFPDETEELRGLLPYWTGGSNGCAGMYTHDHVAASGDGQGANQKDRGPKRMLVALRSSLLHDQFALVATVAHELGHVILLGGGLMDPRTPDHEPMTDLLTVYLGCGVFNANSSARFKQFQDARYHGWSMQRLGYLREEIYGYALARFATERNQQKPAWARHLSPNVRAYFRHSCAWLARNRHRMRKPAIGAMFSRLHRSRSYRNLTTFYPMGSLKPYEVSEETIVPGSSITSSPSRSLAFTPRPLK